MKIFYAVQATGNGHISRAITLLPYLEQYGKVDVFLSGNNSHLTPALPIKYRSKGISLFYSHRGGLDYFKISTQRNPATVWKEIKELPVENYDLVINDFDMITSSACQLKKVPSIHFGHQASFQSILTPRPSSKSWHGEALLKHYVKAPYHVGLHFKPYDKGIFGAVVKEEILTATPKDHGHITVYLPSQTKKNLYTVFSKIKGQQFIVFSKEVASVEQIENVHFYPIDNKSFTSSLINCKGVICGAGFETPSEALHLGKKILAIPIKGQYEQLCNAAALKELGISCLNEFTKNCLQEINNWMESDKRVKIDYSHSIQDSLSYIFHNLIPHSSYTTSSKDAIAQADLEVHLNNSTFA